MPASPIRVIVDGDAPPWAHDFATQLNAILAAIAARLKAGNL